ncbi:MAG: hypothetical protein QNL62_17070 [Gammaproteobacteria bacterium]|nr:hypothetical protein [Gammaproteobacteria bacterium]
MKLNKRNSIIAVTLISLSSMALAFGPQMGGPGSGGYRMAQELNLTTEQQEQVGDIMTKHREERKSIRDKHREQLEIKLSTVLSPEQLDTFKEMKQQRGKKGMKGKGQKSYERNHGPCGGRPF